MHRIGILSFSSPGHYYPLTALGRRLQSRGHEVVYFQVADLERPIRAAGLRFRQIGREDFPPGALRARDEELGRLTGRAALRAGLRGIALKSMMLFRDAPAAIRDEGIDALLVDQIEMAGGTVAEHLGLPFVSVAAALPVNLDPSAPPVNIAWAHRVGSFARLRNRLGNALSEWIFSGVLRTIDEQRRAWRLPPARGFNSLFSGLAQVSQLPAALELPGRRLPPHCYHTGPWTDAAGRAPVDFPWSRLDPGRPLVYASMGTLQNGILRTFRVIAEACAGQDLQLVISLGGGQDPALLGDLPGDPVVVGYDLARRVEHGPGVAGVGRPDGRPAGDLRPAGGRGPGRVVGGGPVDPGRAADGRPPPRRRPRGPGRPGLPQAGRRPPVGDRGGRRPEPGGGPD
jgi:zeaxanthin glucosyltransferase